VVGAGERQRKFHGAGCRGDGATDRGGTPGRGWMTSTGSDSDGLGAGALRDEPELAGPPAGVGRAGGPQAFGQEPRQRGLNGLRGPSVQTRE